MPGEKDGKRNHENATPPQDKADVKTEGLKAKQFKQKDVSEKEVVKPEGYKKNGVKRKPRMVCREKRMSREEGLKKRDAQR